MPNDSHSADVIALGAGDERPPMGRAFRAEGLRTFRTTNLRGVRPDVVARILSNQARGDLEGFMDLAQYMLRTDDHLSSVYESAVVGIASATSRFDTGRHDPAQEESAEAAAEFARTSIEGARRYEATVKHLIHGGWGLPLGIVEQHWGRRGGAWRVTGHTKVPPRDTKFADDWTPLVRSYDKNAKGHVSERWIRTDEEPLRWLIHAPGSLGQHPHLAGVLSSCVWPFVFKKWVLTYGVQVMERIPAPVLAAFIGENAHQDTPDKTLETLQSLANNGFAVFGNDVTIDPIEVSGANAGDAHIKWIDKLEVGMTKRIVGSTLNVEVGDGGGSRALGESQAKQTTLPRLKSIGDQLSETLGEQWFAPEIKLNRHLFNGAVPPIPTHFFELVQEETPVISDTAVNSGVVTVDELRTSNGLEPIGPERGGDRLVTPVAKTAPSFSQASVEAPAEEPPPPKSLGRVSRPNSPTTSKTSRMFSASTTQIDNVPYEA